PKAGIFAEAAARVVADDIAATISGEQPPAPFAASGICYAEFGDGHVSKVEVNFLSGEAPAAQPYAATLAHAAEKDAFAATPRSPLPTRRGTGAAGLRRARAASREPARRGAEPLWRVRRRRGPGRRIRSRR